MPGQPSDDLDVEVVRRFVEHQDVVARKQHRGQRHPPPLATAEIADLAVQRNLGQQVLHHRPRLCLGRPDVVSAAVDDDVPHRRLRREVVGLVQVPDGQSRRVGDTAGVRWPGGREDLQHRGLAVAVAAHDTDRVALVDAEAHTVEQGARAVADGRAFEVDQVRHQAPIIGADLAGPRMSLCHDDVGLGDPSSLRRV